MNTATKPATPAPSPAPTAPVAAVTAPAPTVTTPAPALAYTRLDPRTIALSLTNGEGGRVPDAEFIGNIKANGVLQAVLVRPLPTSRTDAAAKGKKYELVYGERRVRGAIAADVADIPAEVRTLTDAQALMLQIIENVQREDIHPMVEGEQYERLMREVNPATGKKYSADDIAGKVNKARRTVYTRIQLLKLAPECRAAFHSQKIQLAHAELLARIAHHDTQRTALKEITSRQRYEGADDTGLLNVRAAREWIAKFYTLDLAQSPFDIKVLDYTGTDKKVIAGACGPCPKRTGNNPELFGDVKNADVCTDPKCHAAKRDAHKQRLIDAATKAGKTIITGAAAKKIVGDYGPPKGYRVLDDNLYYDGKNTTLKKLLGKDLPPVSLLDNPRTHELQEVLTEADVQKALKAKGISTGGGKPDPEVRAKERAKQQAQKAAAEDAVTVRSRTTSAIGEAIGKQGGLSLEDFRIVAGTLYANTWSHYRKDIAATWATRAPAVTTPSKSAEKPHTDRIMQLEKRIPAMTASEVMQLMMDCALAPVDAKDALEAAAGRYKVDVNAIKAQVKAERAARASVPAKKPAAKKGGK